MRKVTSCTVTTEAGIASRGKRIRLTSEAWTISDSAAPISDCEKNSQTSRPTMRNRG